MTHRREVGIACAADLVQDIELVTFPAASAVFAASAGYAAATFRLGMLSFLITRATS